MKRENLKSSHRKKTYYIQTLKDTADISLGVMRKEDNEIQSWKYGARKGSIWNSLLLDIPFKNEVEVLFRQMKANWIHYQICSTRNI